MRTCLNILNGIALAVMFFIALELLVGALAMGWSDVSFVTGAAYLVIALAPALSILTRAHLRNSAAVQVTHLAFLSLVVGLLLVLKLA